MGGGFFVEKRGGESLFRGQKSWGMIKLGHKQQTKAEADWGPGWWFCKTGGDVL